MVKTFFALAAVLATAASFQAADAHSMMTVPKPNSEINNSPSGTIDGPNTLTVPEGMSFGYGPAQNTEAFLKAFKAQTKYKTIRDMIYDKFQPDGASTKECGQSAATGTPQALPDYVEYGGGLDLTHEGPCEVWCDDVRVFYEDNCSVKYTEKPAKLPYEKAKCAGAKRLQSFWLALHVPAWQAYISCATLSGAGASASGGSASAGNSTTPAATPASTPATTPASTPSASSGDSGNDDEYSDDTTTTAPSSTPAASSASDDEYSDDTTTAPTSTPASTPASTPSSKPSGGKCTKRARRV